MTVSNTEINPHQRIAQLEHDIALNMGEINRIKEQIIVNHRRRGLSLRDIAAEPGVNLSHSQVAVIIKVYEARRGPIKVDDK